MKEIEILKEALAAVRKKTGFKPVFLFCFKIVLCIT